MTAALPLFGDSRDWVDLRTQLTCVYSTWYWNQPHTALIRVRGYGRGVRMAEKAAQAFLRDHDFVESSNPRSHTVHHRDGTVTVTREWIGPHGTATTITRAPHITGEN